MPPEPEVPKPERVTIEILLHYSYQSYGPNDRVPYKCFVESFESEDTYSYGQSWEEAKASLLKSLQVEGEAYANP